MGFGALGILVIPRHMQFMLLFSEIRLHIQWQHIERPEMKPHYVPLFRSRHKNDID